MQTSIEMPDLHTPAGEAIEKMIDPSWIEPLKHHLHSQYMMHIAQHVAKRRKEVNVYPAKENMFKALTLPLSDVKVVVVGQDPYHNPGQADGLAFSCAQFLSPSLTKIFEQIWKEVLDQDPDKLERYLKYWPSVDEIPAQDPTGRLRVREVMPMSLERWHRQGVLLLNRFLTVEQGKPNSHAQLGWDRFTDAVIKTVSNHARPTVFMLWGKQAQGVKRLIDTRKHYVIEREHPAASTYRGTAWDSDLCFNACNVWLENKQRGEVIW